MPRVGRRDVYIEAGLRVAEYGLEHLSFVNVGMRCGVSGAAVAYHFKDHGGFPALRRAVIELAQRRGNHFVLGQLAAMRALPEGQLFARVDRER